MHRNPAQPYLDPLFPKPSHFPPLSFLGPALWVAFLAASPTVRSEMFFAIWGDTQLHENDCYPPAAPSPTHPKCTFSIMAKGAVSISEEFF